MVEPGDQSFGTSLAVDGTRHNASGIASPLATWVESFYINMVEHLVVTRYAQWRRRACLNTYNNGFVSQEALSLTPKQLESLAQSVTNELRQPLVKS